jgi:hypothetical protein
MAFSALLAAASYFRIPSVFAFLCLSALLLASAAPIALAWARVIPSDDPEDSPSISKGSILFLIFVSLSFAARVPGVPRSRLESWILGYFPADWAPWLVLTAQIILILIPGVVALHAAFRTKPVDQTLLWSGLLVALLWLVSPFLTKSWLGAASF